MNISLTCSCGRHFKVADRLAGKRVKCTACGAAVAVPADDIVSDGEVVGDDELARMNLQKRPAGEDDPPTRMSMELARKRQHVREMKRKIVAGRGGQGFSLFGVQFTTGVVIGFGMLVLGLLIFALITVNHDAIVRRGRAYGLAIGCTTIGVFTLVRAIVFGQEE